MRSILIIKNNYELGSELQKRLAADCYIYVATDSWEGLDIIDEKHIDIFMIMSDDHIEKATWNFLNELHKSRSQFTPIIFISKKPSEDLNANLYKNSSWYFISYPIDNEGFMSVIQGALEMSDLINEKSILLEKNGHDYFYQIKNISRIQRSRNRYLKIYSRHPQTQVEEEREFFYDAPLHEFLQEYGIEKQMKQAYQSWLVNVSQVKEIITKDKELVLTNGVVVPTSRKYITNFKRKKVKKE